MGLVWFLSELTKKPSEMAMYVEPSALIVSEMRPSFTWRRGGKRAGTEVNERAQEGGHGRGRERWEERRDEEKKEERRNEKSGGRGSCSIVICSSYSLLQPY